MNLGRWKRKVGAKGQIARQAREMRGLQQRGHRSVVRWSEAGANGIRVHKVVRCKGWTIMDGGGEQGVSMRVFRLWGLIGEVFGPKGLGCSLRGKIGRAHV